MTELDYHLSELRADLRAALEEVDAFARSPQRRQGRAAGLVTLIEHDLDVHAARALELTGAGGEVSPTNRGPDSWAVGGEPVARDRALESLKAGVRCALAALDDRDNAAAYSALRILALPAAHDLLRHAGARTGAGSTDGDEAPS